MKNHNHLANYYLHLFFIVLLGLGTALVSLLGSFAEMLKLYELSYQFNILLTGFNAVLIIAIIRGWPSIDKEIKRRAKNIPLTGTEREWLKKYSRYLFLFHRTPLFLNDRKGSRLKLHLLLMIVVAANAVSIMLNLHLLPILSMS